MSEFPSAFKGCLREVGDPRKSEPLFEVECTLASGSHPKVLGPLRILEKHRLDAMRERIAADPHREVAVVDRGQKTKDGGNIYEIVTGTPLRSVLMATLPTSGHSRVRALSPER